MTTLLLERQEGKLRRCDAACYDASSPDEECKCVCGGTNHARGVSGLFGEDVPRKEQYLAQRHEDFMTELARLSAANPDDRVYGGIRMNPSQRTASEVQVFEVSNSGLNVTQILHRCRHYSARRIRCKSPTGFNWGYGGPGPTELSRYILSRAIGYHYFWSEAVCHLFKLHFIGTAGDTWVITASQIREWNNGRRAARRRHAK